MKTKQCLNKNGEGCKAWLPADNKHFGSYPRYDDVGKKTWMLYALCIECKAIHDAANQRKQQDKGNGNRNKKEVMDTGYGSCEEKWFLREHKPTEVERISRYATIHK